MVAIELFRTWLEALPPGTEFDTRSQCHCPLARYTGNPVQPDRMRVGPDAYEKLPPWATEFVRRVDVIGPNTANFGQITKEEVIRILDEVELHHKGGQHVVL